MTAEEQAAADAAAAAKKKVEFTQEQQDHIQNLFNQRFAKIKEQEEAKAKALQEQIDALKAQQPTKEPVAATDEELRKQNLALLNAEKQNTATVKTAWEQEKAARIKVEEENAKILKDQAIINAASRLGTVEFHDLNLVKELVQGQVFFDKDSNQFVVKENGVVKNNSSMQPMSLSEYFLAFATDRPYLVKGVAKGGSGSSESGRNSNQFDAGVIRSKADLSKGTKEQAVKAKSDYISKFGYEQFAKLPAK